MRHIKNYKIFEDETPIVSYDFDGTLHLSVTGIHPINFDKPQTWAPFLEMHKQMREDAKNNKIVIVTARDQWMKPYVQEFVKMHNLPVSEIYCTDNEKKTPVLKSIKAWKHYDDNIKIKNDVVNAGMVFVHVDPIHKTQKILETLQDENMKNFVITLTNNKFYIADKTIKAFVDGLKKVEPDFFYNPLENGKINNGRILYIRSTTLTSEQIRDFSKEFSKKYDFLTINSIRK